MHHRNTYLNFNSFCQNHTYAVSNINIELQIDQIEGQTSRAPKQQNHRVLEFITESQAANAINMHPFMRECIYVSRTYAESSLHVHEHTIDAHDGANSTMECRPSGAQLASLIRTCFSLLAPRPSRIEPSTGRFNPRDRSLIPTHRVPLSNDTPVEHRLLFFYDPGLWFWTTIKNSEVYDFLGAIADTFGVTFGDTTAF